MAQVQGAKVFFCFLLRIFIIIFFFHRRPLYHSHPAMERKVITKKLAQHLFKFGSPWQKTHTRALLWNCEKQNPPQAMLSFDRVLPPSFRKFLSPLQAENFSRSIGIFFLKVFFENLIFYWKFSIIRDRHTSVSRWPGALPWSHRILPSH